jgi:hypothetical protein
MTHRLLPRALSLALAVLVTGSLFSGIDALALQQHAGHELMAAHTAAARPAA